MADQLSDQLSDQRSGISDFVSRQFFILVMAGLMFCTSAFAQYNKWEKKQWISRVARLLRYNGGLTKADDLGKLAEMSKREVVEYFLADPRFNDTLLDFNLFFLGVKEGGLRDSTGRFQDRIFDHPSAITSVREFAKGGDYLRLLDRHQPIFLQTYEKLFNSPDKSMSNEEYRAYSQRNWIPLIEKMIEKAEGGLEDNRVAICKLVYPDAQSVVIAPRYFGLPVNLFSIMRSSFDAWGAFYFPCVFPEVKFPTIAFDRMKAFRDLAPEYMNLLESIKPENYKPKYASDLKELDFKKFGMHDDSLSLTRGFYSTLTNSSTNFNRRRAAFILKRYFCDDLTPINIVPDDHSKGRHGSEASCQACHYKLDPMAGFFKSIGYGGYDFTYTSTIRFDDNVIIPRQNYENEWLSSSDQRKWNIGYIRSTEFDDKNSYGESVDDLYEIIRTAPEVKQCIVKRAIQYLWGSEQIVDAGYIDYLTQEFTNRAQKNSSTALKELWITLLSSQTFAKNDPKSSECYDYAPGENPEGKPPCRVAFLLERNCTQCHSQSSPRGGLDLSQWIETGSGEMNFPHHDGKGQQLSLKKTLSSIVFRMSSQDSDLRMPLSKFITSSDREELVLWAEKMLEGK